MRLLRLHDKILCAFAALLIGVLINGNLAGFGIQVAGQGTYSHTTDAGQTPPLDKDGHGHRLAIPLLGTVLTTYDERLRFRSVDGPLPSTCGQLPGRYVPAGTDTSRPVSSEAADTPASRKHLLCVYRL